MARRDQPYIPLFVKDYLTDNKLKECSAESHGVYINLICLMHLSHEYGVILLKQKYKQKSSTCLNFAYQLAKHLPFSVDVIERAIAELLAEDVIQNEGDKLSQKRMVKDAKLSDTRSTAGRQGGKQSQSR